MMVVSDFNEEVPKAEGARDERSDVAQWSSSVPSPL